MTNRPLQRSARRGFRLTGLRVAIMVFSLLAVLALTADLVSLRLRAAKALSRDGVSSQVAEALIEATVATNRWTDPAGRFSLVQPAGWTAGAGGVEEYDLVLRGPMRMEIRVAVRPAGPGGLEALRLRLGAIETNLHLSTGLQAAEFQGAPAWQRTMRLPKSTVETLDFLRRGWAVHLLMSAPGDVFADLRPVLAEVRGSLALAEGE